MRSWGGAREGEGIFRGENLPRGPAGSHVCCAESRGARVQFGVKEYYYYYHNYNNCILQVHTIHGY